MALSRAVPVATVAGTLGLLIASGIPTGTAGAAAPVPASTTLCCSWSPKTASCVAGSKGRPSLSDSLCPDPPGDGVEISIPNASDIPGWSACVPGADGGAPQCPPVVKIQTSEPPTGFVGVCLAPHLTYAPSLPSVCYAVKLPDTVSSQMGGGNVPVPLHAFTVVSATATHVFSAYGTADTTLSAASYDSYQVLMTCYPHGSAGDCPSPSLPVSRSCCDLGTHMTSLFKKIARGFATMPTPIP
jgi:hypothetical protein